MFTPMMASAAGYAATAYFYNLGRFKFDAEQRQDCIYQIQNMRLATGIDLSKPIGIKKMVIDGLDVSGFLTKISSL